YTNDVKKYDTMTKTWKSAGKIPKKLDGYIPVQIADKVFIAGGREGNVLSSKLYIYDTESETCATGSDMPNACSSYIIGSYEDSLIYIIGGFTDTSYFNNTVQVYNINTNVWDYGTPYANEEAMYLSGSISGNKILLAGGYREIIGITDEAWIGTIDSNDPYTISWEKTSYPGGAVIPSAGSWYGKEKQYVFFLEDDLWTYDIKRDEWLYGKEQLITLYDNSSIVPITRNDSVYMVVFNRGYNEWLYIGKDERLIGVNEEPNLSAPKEYSLLQNYPNPFNPSTKIKYSLREPGHVTLTVYDMLGREIKTLINETMSAGGHEVIFNAGELNLSSGIYLYRIKSGSFVQTKKFMLIK
ncbi:MAG TPA: T9SS type A sorting domain-containing protein, partial [Ignavibacteriales bacterium]|nr:T9SS type A sorting domain-containing protein [Ignavibacteriales bacterium]